MEKWSCVHFNTDCLNISRKMQSHFLSQGVESVIWEFFNNKKDGYKLRISHCPRSYRTQEAQTGHCGVLEGDSDPGWMELERLCGKRTLALTWRKRVQDIWCKRWKMSSQGLQSLSGVCGSDYISHCDWEIGNVSGIYIWIP